jgi:fatty-acyl-CoA synthase
MHSGGTTGLPKIVRLSNKNLSYRHWTLQLAAKYVIGEVILHDAPMFHVGGLIGRWLAPMASGASALIPSVMGARDKRYIANYWKFVEKYKVTRLSGVPTTLAVLAKSAPSRLDLSSLHPYFITGSSVLPSSVRDAFERVSAVRVLNSYGMTENTASIAIDPRDGPNKPGSSGIRVPFTQMRAVSTDGHSRLCGPNEIGMLHVRGPGVAPGYVNPAHDARTQDGWLITGDLGRIDSDGYVFVTGRAKDIIIRSGHNIDPGIIEEPLLHHTQVLHAAAVGKPDSYAGELPVVYVQLVSGSQTTTDELIAYLTARITERAAIPKEVFIVDKLALTEVGKPNKAALRKDVAERTFRSVISAATGPLCEEVHLEVTIQSRPKFGETVMIAMTGVGAAARSETSKEIEKAMNGYSHPYMIEWR